MNSKRVFLAVLLAPWSSLITVALMYIELIVRDGFSISIGDIYVFLMFCSGFISISYAFVIIVGIPTHYIFTRLKIKSWALYMLAGILWALLYQYIELNMSTMPGALSSTGLKTYGITSIFVSLSFWYLAVKSVIPVSNQLEVPLVTTKTTTPDKLK